MLHKAAALLRKKYDFSSNILPKILFCISSLILLSYRAIEKKKELEYKELQKKRLEFDERKEIKNKELETKKELEKKELEKKQFEIDEKILNSFLNERRVNFNNGVINSNLNNEDDNKCVICLFNIKDVLSLSIFYVFNISI